MKWQAKLQNVWVWVKIHWKSYSRRVVTSSLRAISSKLTWTADFWRIPCSRYLQKRDPEGHHVAYRKFREDPENNPLTTPSGKIEIYSSQLANIKARWELASDDVIDPLPVYSAGFESYGDPAMEKYPLQMTGFHYKSRTHSTYGNVDVLKQLALKKCGSTCWCL